MAYIISQDPPVNLFDAVKTYTAQGAWNTGYRAGSAGQRNANPYTPHFTDWNNYERGYAAGVARRT